MHFIYLHGFNSAFDPSSEKIKHLETLGRVTGITYNTFGTYDEIFDELWSQIEYSDDLVFVGTSLGGFWAAEMAREFHTPSIIINPCIDPYKMLRKYVGIEQTNYHTSEVNTLLDSTVDTYLELCVHGREFTYFPLVLLDMGDEVIDSFETREALEGFPMIHYAEGSHRFDHMHDALEEINKYLNHCSYVEQANV